MKRLAPSAQEKRLNDLVTNASVILRRFELGKALGQSYNGSRDLYQALGYSTTITFKQYEQIYQREDIAKVLIEKLPKACWTSPPEVIQDPENLSDFEKEFIRICKGLKLYSTFYRLDKLLGLGEYAVLFLGFNGETANLKEEVQASEGLKLQYIKAFSSDDCKIDKYETDVNNERYGLPTLYKISNTINDDQKKELFVHWSRIIHVVEDPLNNDVKGSPRLEAVYNRLQDVQKVLGGSAEMFWRGARPGHAAEADADASFGKDEQEALQAELDEYEHNLRRFIRSQGVKIKSLAVQVSSPKDHLDAQLNVIAIVTGIPKRILMGSERGELASSQDQQTWNNLVYERQINFCEPCVIRPFIDKLIELGLLTLPEMKEGTAEDAYELEWQKVLVLGEKEKAEIAKTRTQALGEYLKTPGADLTIPLDLYLRKELGYTKEEIELIMAYVEETKEQIAEEEEEARLVEAELKKEEDDLKKKEKGI